MFGFLKRSADVPSEMNSALEGSFTTDEIREMNRFGTTLHLGSGTKLATEGRPGREVFLIVSGTADVQRDGETIATVGATDVVGEAAVLTNEPRNATLVTTSAVQCIVFSRRDFSSLLTACPQLDVRMHELAESRA